MISTPRRTRPAVSGWLGPALVAGAWIGLLAVQIASGDYLPPTVSISQYGVGPHGWIFTVWMLCVAGSAAAVYLSSGVHWWPAAVLIGAGVLGAVVIAVIRTDAGGLQHSWHAKVHMVGAIMTLSALPVGLALVALRLDRRLFRLALATAAVASVALILLLTAAFGVDTLGSGAPSAWAFWQSVATVAELALVTELTVFLARRRPPPG